MDREELRRIIASLRQKLKLVVDELESFKKLCTHPVKVYDGWGYDDDGYESFKTPTIFTYHCEDCGRCWEEEQSPPYDYDNEFPEKK